MLGLLWLEPAIPFASALVLLTAGRKMGRRAAAWLGCVSIAASFAVAAAIALVFLPGGQTPYTQVVWQWIAVGTFHPAVALYLDPLAVVMTLTVTFVALLIHIYSTGFMLVPEHGHSDIEGYERFFGYMNLFVASMLTLVLASNLLLLLLGWEGVGLCSYLLIGFWYRDEANGLAGRKAFIVTRVGDTAFILGLFLLFNSLGTLDIQPMMLRAQTLWHPGQMAAEVACFLLLGGAVGKSAQFPLQTWLPDAMAGPTPTSALIHAATMVTAGVYLIARTHGLFVLAPGALTAVAVVGLVTLLMAGCSALAQRDIKRILAYSTISQIGYMFLALGVGAWSAAIFHLVTHAFFKALLFLAAGVVIQAMHGEHDIFKMGGLRRQMPLAFWCFVFAGSSLAGLPLISAGFYSKDFIIWSAWGSTRGHFVLWLGAMIGALLTALYIFRLIVVAFLGDGRHRLDHRPGLVMQWPMVILGYLSMLGGFFAVPALLDPSLLPFGFHPVGISEVASEGIAAAVFFLGLYLVWRFYVQDLARAAGLVANPSGRWWQEFWHGDWGMDFFYDRALVRPTAAMARFNRHDGVDKGFTGIAWLSAAFYRGLSGTQTGRVRRYAGWITAGAILLLVLSLWTGGAR